MNPHKWLFVPVDLSVLYVRDPELLRRTFSLVADYLVTPETDVHNYMDYGLQLGRRFRALKLWFALRTYGVSGMQAAPAHAHRARAGARDVDRSGDRAGRSWRRTRFRWCASATRRSRRTNADAVDALNLAIMDAVNATGDVFLSSTRLHGRVVLRIAIGNERTTRDDVRLAWDLLRREAARRGASANALPRARRARRAARASLGPSSSCGSRRRAAAAATRSGG